MDTRHPLLIYAARTGISVAAIASRAGCSRMTIYRLVAGKQNATLDLLERVSSATNGEVPITAFLPAPEKTEAA